MQDPTRMLPGMTHHLWSGSRYLWSKRVLGTWMPFIIFSFYDSLQYESSLEANSDTDIAMMFSCMQTAVQNKHCNRSMVISNVEELQEIVISSILKNQSSSMISLALICHCWTPWQTQFSMQCGILNSECIFYRFQFGWTLDKQLAVQTINYILCIQNHWSKILCEAFKAALRYL